MIQVDLSAWRPGTPLLWNSVINPSAWAELAVRSTKVLLHGDQNLFKLESGLASEPHLSSGEGALATLPITLFFHNDLLALRQQLHQTVQIFQAGSLQAGSLQAGSLAIAYAITQALTERLQPSHLIAQTIAYLQQDATIATSEPSGLADLIQQLKRLQRLLQQGISLQSTLIELLQPGRSTGNHAIVLAFYCFLSAPADFRLSVLRAARITESTPIVTALTGVLSGAYNSVAGLPLAWSMAESRTTHLGSSPEIKQLASQLLAAWSGAFDLTDLTSQAAIAAPGVIRPIQ
jgi:ADP-ribosylglycohydrolase